MNWSLGKGDGIGDWREARAVAWRLSWVAVKIAGRWPGEGWAFSLFPLSKDV